MAWRALTALEVAEARTLFGDGLGYAKVRLLEEARWTNVPARLQAWLARSSTPLPDNAIALGHRLYFPRPLRTSAAALASGDLGDMAWLIHELTHVWQTERIGMRYAWQALGLLVRMGAKAYGYGGEAAVRSAVLDGRGLQAFHVEQQAEIARDAYLARRLGASAAGWDGVAAHFHTRPASEADRPSPPDA
jgi:hypothetical protein